MQSRNQVLDDLARLVTNALGLAQNASGEIDNAFKSLLDRYLADRGLVTREEFDASQLMLEKAMNEISELRKNLEKAEKQPSTKVVRNNSKKSANTNKSS